MRKLTSQLFKQVASDTAKKNLLPHEGPLSLLFQNGYGFYVQPLIKLEFVFGLDSGDALGLRSFINHRLPSLAARYPHIEFQVCPRNGKMAHVRGSYTSGPDKLLDAYNKSAGEIGAGLRLLMERDGAAVSKFRTGVRSVMPAVRPLWSPFHASRSNVLSRFVAQIRAHQQRRRTLIFAAQSEQQVRLAASKQKLQLNPLIEKQ